MSNDYISVSNSEPFATIDEVFEKVFSSKNPRPMKGYFEPLPSFTGTEIAGCHIWFPKLKSNETSWKNKFDGDEITSKNDSDKGKAQVGQKNITFTHTGKGYVFAGIFKLDQIDADGTEHWKRIDDKCPIIGNKNKPLAAMLIIFLLFLAMLIASPSYADIMKDIEDYDKSLLCCSEYQSDAFRNCVWAAGNDCKTKTANEKKDQQNKFRLCYLEGGKKCKKTIDEALADSGGVEKIPGIKNIFSLGDSLTKLGKEEEKIKNDTDMMKAKKEKQLELLEQKKNKFMDEWNKIIQKQILNAPITLKGIYVNDFEGIGVCSTDHSGILMGGTGLCQGGWEDSRKDYINHRDRNLWDRNNFSWSNSYYDIGRYEKSPFSANIIATKKFMEEANKGIYDITGTITGFQLGTKPDQYGQVEIYLTIQLKSAKYIGKKEK